MIDKYEENKIENSTTPASLVGRLVVCDVCHGYNYILLGCCSGRDCGCLGLPVDSKPCDKCNPDGTKEPSSEAKKGWPWFFAS